MVNVCVPTLRRYDLLKRLLDSLEMSTVLVDKVWIIDNGHRSDLVLDALPGVASFLYQIFTPERPMGVAESWNWFISNVPEERIITNDDIVFAPRSVKQMVETPGDLVFGYGFSCFLIRTRCVERVGLFDETISPGYAYWEDIDYMERAKKDQPGGVVLANASDAGLVHGDGVDGSQTVRAGTQADIDEHWRRYDIAKANFIAKWGGLPEGHA